jgi:hypothetical protein
MTPQEINEAFQLAYDNGFKDGRVVGIDAGGEVAKRFISLIAKGPASPYVSGMNDSAVRIYQCILALKDDKE